MALHFQPDPCQALFSVFYSEVPSNHGQLSLYSPRAEKTPCNHVFSGEHTQNFHSDHTSQIKTYENILKLRTPYHITVKWGCKWRRSGEALEEPNYKKDKLHISVMLIERLEL